MNRTFSTTTPPPSGCVGIWVELPTAELACSQGDERIRAARGLITGLDSLPEVESILVPCLPSAEAIMERLLEHATQPGRLMSPKLKVVPAGEDPVRRDSLTATLRARRARILERLAAMGATPSPRSWRSSIARLAECPARPFAVARRIIKLMSLSLRSLITDARLRGLRSLPPPHATVVADLRRRGASATWIVIAGESGSSRRLVGPTLVDARAFVQPLGHDAPTAARALRRLVKETAIIVAPSRHAATIIERQADGLAVSVLSPVPLPGVPAAGDEGESRQQLARELRRLFSGDGGNRLHRHFCDFPFERVDYLVTVPPRDASPILPAYAAVVRRHRRDLKLLVDGRLPHGNGPVAEVHALGLSFDVAEAAGLTEAARARVLRHAKAVVVPDLEAWQLPAVLSEAVAAGTPVVLARSPAVLDALSDAECASPAYFAGGSDADESLTRAILHVLDHRAEVLDQQRDLVARLADRTWRDVAADYLRLARSHVHSG